MPSDTSAAAEDTKAIDWNNVAERPRFPRGHPRAGQFVPVNDPPELIPFLGALDRRTARAQVYLDRLEAFIADRGGTDAISNGEAALCKQAAGLETLLTEYVTDHLAGREVDVDKWLSAVGHFRRVVTTLGLKRHAAEINAKPFGLRQSMGLE